MNNELLVTQSNHLVTQSNHLVTQPNHLVTQSNHLVMKILIINILIIFCIAVVIIGVYILIRNDYVYKYRCQISDKCYSIVSEQLNSIPIDESWDVFNEQLKVHNEYNEMWDSIRKQNSYEKMLYSFKPLKDKYWLTEKQINWLKLY